MNNSPWNTFLSKSLYQNHLYTPRFSASSCLLSSLTSHSVKPSLLTCYCLLRFIVLLCFSPTRLCVSRFSIILLQLSLHWSVYCYCNLWPGFFLISPCTDVCRKGLPLSGGFFFLALLWSWRVSLFFSSIIWLDSFPCIAGNLSSLKLKGSWTSSSSTSLILLPNGLVWVEVSDLLPTLPKSLSRFWPLCYLSFLQQPTVQTFPMLLGTIMHISCSCSASSGSSVPQLSKSHAWTG